MIDALDYTIEQLLRRELDVQDGGIEISFSQPNGQWAARRMGPTVNLFLYDVRENPALRRHQWQQASDQRIHPQRPGAAVFKRTPLMMDCFYLVTAWSGADESARPTEEHRLLSRALWALAQYPVLNAPFVEMERAEALAGIGYTEEHARDTVMLESRSPGQKSYEQDVLRRAWLNKPEHNPLRAVDVEIRARLAQHDVLTNPSEVWSALEAQMRAGFSYVVTLPLSPWIPYETERVRTQQMQFLPARYDAESSRLQPVQPPAVDLLYTISGAIRDRAGIRQAGLRLQLLHGAATEHRDGAAEDGTPHRRITKTNAKGEYRFSDLPPETYTLLIHQPPSETVVREFTLSPAGPTGFDFTI